MLRNTVLQAILATIALLLAGCTMHVDAPQTPTVIVSPTVDETAIARLATDTPTAQPTVASPTPSSTSSATTTPSPTRTSTRTPTASPTHTMTSTSTATQTYTATSSPSPTVTMTPSPTATSAPSVTATRTHTSTPTLTPTATEFPPSPTATSTASVTPRPTRTPTQPIAQLQIPTATPRRTTTFTPFPSITPDLSQTAQAQFTATASPTVTAASTATQAPTVTRTASPAPQPESPGEAVETFFDPNAPAADQDALPVAPAGDTGPSGPTIPEQNTVIVSYAGQVVPILTVPDGINTGPAIAEGDIFAVNDSGQIAAVDRGGELRIDASTVTVSPASEFGLHPNLNYGDLAWSPNGHYLAFRVDADDPQDFNGIDTGIWIYETATNRSWQVFRNTYAGQVTQQHEQRRALSVTWAPNNTALAITVATPVGQRIVFLPVEHNVNEWVDSLPHADATWTTDSTGLIVSGTTENGQAAVGRVNLDAFWTYTKYLDQATTGLTMQAATQLNDRRIAFLGADAGSFALYATAAISNSQPTRLSQPITGQIIAAEWNSERTAVLITTQTDNQQLLWIIRIDGTVRNTTPNDAALSDAHWR